jgi:hypothetical protein
MTNVNEVWADTGVVVERDYTPQELAQREADAKEYAETKAKEDADKAAKEAAQAKLVALGLTADDLKALGLGNN